MLHCIWQLLGSERSAAQPESQDSFLRQLFVQRHPTNIRVTLASVGDVPFDNLAGMADNIAECAVPVVRSVTPATSVAQTFDFEERLQHLMKTVNVLQLPC